MIRTGWLLARYRHPVNAQRWGSDRPAKLEVTANFADVREHVFQIAGHRDFLHRKCQFAVLDPQSARPAREIASHQVDAEAQKLGYQQAFLDVADDLLHALRTRLEEEVSRPD